MSIRAVSRAREQGLVIVPGQMASHQTLAGLATVLTRDKSSLQTSQKANNSNRRTGKAVALPIQQWFLNRTLAEPAHWNLARLLEVDARVGLEDLQRALDCCVAHHDALRAVFAQDANTGLWMQSIGAPTRTALDIIEIDPGDSLSLDRAIGSRQSQFDIGHGPLFKFAVINVRPGTEPSVESASSPTSSGTRRQLLLIFHHLVMDAVSLMVLVDDLDRLLTQRLQGESPDIGHLTTTMLSYSDAMDRYLDTPQYRTARQFWTETELVFRDLPPLPADTELPGRFYERDAAYVKTVLNADLTAALTGIANEA